MILNKKGISPLVATIILIIFSLLLGMVTMNLGKAYIEKLGDVDTKTSIAREPDTKYIGSSLYKCAAYDTSTSKCAKWELVR